MNWCASIIKSIKSILLNDVFFFKLQTVVKCVMININYIMFIIILKFVKKTTKKPHNKQKK